MTTFNHPRPLSTLVPSLTKDLFGRKNMLFGKMMSEWAHIAGPEIASRTTPLELKFQRQKEGVKGQQKGSAQAILHLGVQTAFALEMSYQKSLLIERLNMFYGYAAIKDIKIIQHSEVMNNKKRPQAKIRPVTLQEQQKIDAMIAGTDVPLDKVMNNDLQEALKRLGKSILARKSDKD